MLDLAIRGGDVVATQGTGKWSVGVKDGKIAFVGFEDQAVQAAKVIDATGKLVEARGVRGIGLIPALPPPAAAKGDEDHEGC